MVYFDSLTYMNLQIEVVVSVLYNCYCCTIDYLQSIQTRFLLLIRANWLESDACMARSLQLMHPKISATFLGFKMNYDPLFFLEK